VKPRPYRAHDGARRYAEALGEPAFQASFWLPLRLLDQVDAIRASENKSRAAVLRQLVTEALEARERG